MPGSYEREQRRVTPRRRRVTLAFTFRYVECGNRIGIEGLRWSRFTVDHLRAADFEGDFDARDCRFYCLRLPR